MDGRRYAYEDFEPGRQFQLGPRTISAEEIIEFASEFDNQPMHVDEEAGRASILGGLAASGWHTSALQTSMMIESFLKDTMGEGSPGIDTLEWKAPVLAGDTLSGVSTVTGRRPSGSRPGIGIVSFSHELFNQDGKRVLLCTNPILIRMRGDGAAS